MGYHSLPSETQIHCEKVFEMINSQTYDKPISLMKKKKNCSATLKFRTEMFTNDNKSQHEFLLSVLSVAR